MIFSGRATAHDPPDYLVQDCLIEHPAHSWFGLRIVASFRLPYLHRLLQGVYAQEVVGDLGDLVPRVPGGVRDRLLEIRGGCTVGDHVQPVAVAPVLGHAAFVGGKEDAAGRPGEPLYL